MKYYVAGMPYSDELYHHGVIGQKWGIRRYQYRDGSLTAEGRKHYKVGDPKSTFSEYTDTGSNGSRRRKISNAVKNAVDKGSKIVNNIGETVAPIASKAGKAIGTAGKATARYATQQLKKAHPSLMTDQELREYTNRLVQEQNYIGMRKKLISGSAVGKAKEFVGDILKSGTKTLADAGFKKIASEMTKSKLEREDEDLKKLVSIKESKEKLSGKPSLSGLTEAIGIAMNPNASSSEIKKANEIFKQNRANKAYLDDLLGTNISKADSEAESKSKSNSITYDPPSTPSGYAPKDTYRMRPLESMGDLSTKPGSVTKVYTPPVTVSGYAPRVWSGEVSSPSSGQRKTSQTVNSRSFEQSQGPNVVVARRLPDGRIEYTMVRR